MMTKSEQRKEMLARRDMEDSGVRLKHSRIICETLRAQEFYREAESVYCYVSFRSEVDTRGLLQTILSDGKRLFVPKIETFEEKREMRFYEIHAVEELSPGYYGIQEPGGCASGEGELHPAGLMLMPGAAFDRSGRRIGYGGGYYDRYLERYPGFYKAALAFECQLCEKVVQEETDVRVNAVITENGIYHISNL